MEKKSFGNISQYITIVISTLTMCVKVAVNVAQ